MMFWIVAAALTAAVAAWVSRPMWRRFGAAPPRSAHDVAVFKSQLSEIDRDLERGVITEAEAEGARREISRRLLAAAAQAEQDDAIAPAPPRAAQIALGVVALIVVAGGAIVYAAIGSPGLPDRPLATRDFAAERAETRLTQETAERLYAQERAAAEEPPTAPEPDPELAQLVAQMERAVSERPSDARGRILLARAYMSLDRAPEAWPLLAEAIELMGDGAPPDLFAALGQAMVTAAGGYVSQDAEAAFATIPDAPISRYFVGLAAAQDGLPDRAIEIWVALLADAPDAAFSETLRGQIQELAARAGFSVDLGALDPAADAPGPTAEDVEAAAELSPEDRAAMIEGMVEGLAARLEEKPDDLDGWLRLLTSYRALGRADALTTALERARAVFAEDAAALTALRQAAEGGAPALAPSN